MSTQERQSEVLGESREAEQCQHKRDKVRCWERAGKLSSIDTRDTKCGAGRSREAEQYQHKRDKVGCWERAGKLSSVNTRETKCGAGREQGS